MGGSALDRLPQRLAVCLRASQPEDKLACVHALQSDWLAGRLAPAVDLERAPIDQPGQPDRPSLVPPQQVPRRRADTLPGRVALIHALAHIEFNAINLALDAAHRFAGMPPAYYADWLRVADEEALHFDLLTTHLATLGFAYGDFPAHNGLWDMALKTAHDPLVRLRVFNTEQMNQAVFAFRRYEDASLRYTGLDSHPGLTVYGLYDTVVARE